MSGAIRIHNLVKHYGPVEAVRGLDLEIAEGEIFGLIGPDGEVLFAPTESHVGREAAQNTSICERKRQR